MWMHKLMRAFVIGFVTSTYLMTRLLGVKCLDLSMSSMS